METRTVRMLVSVATETGVANIGAVEVLPTAQAAAWIAAGLCEAVTPARARARKEAK